MGYLSKFKDLEYIENLEKIMQTRDQAGLDKVKLALQAFVMEPKSILKRKIQAASVSTDFQQTLADAFNVTIEEDNFDMAWEKAFRTVPLGQNQDFWEIYNVVNGITFKRVEEGQRIEMDTLTGDLVTAYVDYYGGALGYSDKMIRFRKVAAMLDLARLFRNKFWINKANNHYALLAVAAALNVTTWQGTVGQQLAGDILTLNTAAYTLANRCKDKGYGDTANTRLLIYANPLDKGRLLAAIAATTGALSALGLTGVVVNYNFDLNFTFNQNIIQTHPIMVLPGNKIQKAEAMAPTTYVAEKDPFTLNEAQAVWSIYGAIIADTDQCEQFDLD
jgi:hypothetical protein